ncbi:MAG: hypothetical protein RL417_1252 [Pseudomonadota bacterium]
MLRFLETFGGRLHSLLGCPAVLSAFTFLICLVVSLELVVPDPDLFARVAVGHLISILGEVPFTDPFASPAFCFSGPYTWGGISSS